MFTLEIPGEHYPDPPKTMPQALGRIRQYFINGGRETCSLEYDGLIMKIDLRPGWDPEKRLP